MISFFHSQKLANKKLFFYKGRSLFVVVPIALLFALLVFAASQAKNITNIAHDAIFSPIQGQNEIIELTKSAGNQRVIDILNSASSSGYSQTDIATISELENVEKANLVTNLPIDIIKVSDLFAEKSFTIDNLAGLDATYAALYTNNSFEYKEGKPIPIILNANDFVEVYEDWGDKTEIEIKFSSTSNSTAQTQGPIKARAIEYDRDALIGKSFTVSFGGLQELQSYKQETTSSGFKYTKKSEKELTTEEKNRKTAISKYWDYAKISKPLTFTFIVAGISEGTDKTTAFVPQEFATILMKEYLSVPINARTKTSMPSTDYNVTYIGLVYDGVTLQEDATTSIFAGIRNSVTDQVKSQFNTINKQIASQNSRIASTNQQIDQANREATRPPGMPPGTRRVDISKIGSIGSLDSNDIKIKFPDASTSYSIPGLVFKKDRTTNALSGEYKSFDYTKPLPLVSNSILLKLKNTSSRETVVAKLNETGFNYTDYSKYKQYEVLEGYISTILIAASGSVVAITGLFVLINMAKFVSESKKEIGIFRAIGGTKADIRKLIMNQSLNYISAALVLGGITGVLINYTASNSMMTSAQKFITNTLGSNLILNGNLNAAQFQALDIEKIGLYAVGLIVISLIVTLIPAAQAARVSPVEAMRGAS